MAPEQLAGKSRADSDQYALAVVVYEWITGRVPFQETIIEVVMQHATQPPPSFVAQVPEVPKEVEAIVFKALSKDYKERFASIQTFVTAFQHASSPPKLHQPASLEDVGSFRETSLPSALPPAPLPPVEDHAIITPSSALQAPVTETTQPILEAAISQEIKRSVPAHPPQNLPAVASTNERVLPPAHKRGLAKGSGVLLLVLVVLLIAGESYAYSAVNTMQITAVVKAASAAYHAAVAQHGIMFGFDVKHSHNNPYEQILNSANVSQIRQAWAASTGDIITSSPAVVNGVVYVGSADHKLYAFSLPKNSG